MKNEKKRILLLIGIMGIVTLTISLLVFLMLYQTAFNEQEKRLTETVQSQARMMEALMEHETLSHKGDTKIRAAAVIEQVIEGHYRYKALSKTFEFTLARQEGDQIVFLLNHGPREQIAQKPVPFDSNLAEPMRRALSGKSGTLTGLDYQGAVVLAAHEPVAGLNLGLVAKIDLSEIRAPFVKAGMVATGIGMVLIFLGAWLFIKVSEPILVQLQEQLVQMETLVTSLQGSENQVRQIIQNNADAIVVTVDGIIRFANPAAERIFGRAVSDLVGKDFGFPVLEKQSVDIHILHPAGQQVTVTMRAASTEWEKNPAHLISLHDITQRLKMAEKQKKLEQQLVQAQKMESVGRLAGGVAHDYNNALTAIMGFTELAMMDAEPKGPLHDDLNQVLKAGRRAQDITRQLLAFARKQTIAPVTLNLNPTVETMIKMLRRLIGEDIDLVWLPGENLWNVKIDPSQIDQILANLCVNARDAIKGVGKITIETHTVVFDEAYCDDHAGFIPGEFVLLAVSDNGCGMDKKILNQIFEPFFTTKAVDRGTGLGLSTVYGIVKQNNGFINVYSEPGKGTTIKIYLSRHTGKAVERPAESMEEIPRGHEETILVVEDDHSILKLTEKILSSLGYTVLTADTPEKAVTLTRENTDPIHLILTDVIMPEMNGLELSKQIKLQFPDLKCLFMSGYTANAIAHHGVLDEGVHFIQKPFSKKDLAVMIRQVLDES
ncbi:MAG: response regulator [Deltaproteobacteria bacterium]|uniref:response regulator n=1 Tax=Desulfobacula sp. TaxID=2593537 RepID=UPI00199DD902|nr:response regulator [Candidatus Desulfobacula maris]MBL6993102.1 response regulator [Desulfobacula sp.]